LLKLFNVGKSQISDLTAFEMIPKATGTNGRIAKIEYFFNNLFTISTTNLLIGLETKF
jgi:hypothetical protein